MKRKRLLFAAIALVAGALGFNAYAQEAGTYYIQNVGTGKWLGPGNNWGTQASVMNHADYWKLAKTSDGVFTLESVVSNGGSSYYLSGTYCDGGATNFTFTAIAGKENTYSIANASGGYLTTNGTTVDVSATDGSAEASQWKLWSEKDMSDGMAAATVENPFDATYLIKDHDLGRNNRDYSAWNNNGATAPKSSAGSAATTVYSVEAYHKTFDVNQTISDVPNGVYGVKVNGFYRQDGEDTNLPYVYANDQNTTLPARTGSENNMQDAAVSFVAGNYLSNPVYVQVTDGKLKVGVTTTGTTCWVIFKNFHLFYYGDVSINEVENVVFVKDYNAALAAAQEYQDDLMFPADKEALNTAITNNTLDVSAATADELKAATSALNAAASAAATAVNNYKPLLDAIALVKSYDSDLDLSSIEGPISDGTTTLTSPSEVFAAYQSLEIAKLGTEDNTDFTKVIINPSFETGDLTAWNANLANDTGVKPNSNGTYTAEPIDGAYLFNTWGGDAAKYVKQTIQGLPEGFYTVTALVASDADNVITLYAGSAQQGVVASPDGKGVFVEGTTPKVYVEANGSLEFGATSTWWYKVDHFRLTFYSADNSAKQAWEEALAAAQAALGNEDYANVTGNEKSNLQDEIGKDEPTTTAGYTSATEALNTAVAKFVAAKAAYDGYAAEYLYATGTLGMNIAKAEITDASAAEVATQDLKVTEYNDITANYTKDMSSLLSINSEFGTITGQHWDGTGTEYWDTWSGSATTKTLQFSASSLPAGKYILKVAGRSSSGASVAMTDGTTTVDFFANGDQGRGIDTNGATNFSADGTYANDNNGRGWQWRYLPITLAETSDFNATLTATYSPNSWASVTYEVSLLAIPNPEMSKAELLAAINKANEVDAVANVGDGAFQKPQSAAADFQSILGAAQEVYDDPEATIDVLEASTEALNQAIEDFANVELNAPAEDKLYNIINITEGFNHFGKALTFKSASDADLNANTTALGWTEEPGSIYPQGVKFTAVEGVKNGYTLSYTRADGNVIYASTGITSGLGNNTAQIRPTTDASKALTFVVSSTGDNVWNLMNTEDGHNVGSNGDQGFYTAGGSNKDVKIQEAVNNEVTLTAPTAKYGTMILPFDAEAPENVTIYSVQTIDGSSISLNEESSFVANTPYIVYYGAEMEATVSGIGSAYTDENYSTSYLTGVYKQILIGAGTDGKNNYVLQTNQSTGKQAFYIVGENAITIPANRAYLTNSSSNGVKTLNLGDDPTSINALDALTSGAYEGIYTVDGVKLNRMEKGVNILKMADGTTRKVVVK